MKMFPATMIVSLSMAAVTVAMPSLAETIRMTAMLIDAQAADLAAGKIYFNVHTAEHKDGEIRGQVEKGM